MLPDVEQSFMLSDGTRFVGNSPAFHKMVAELALAAHSDSSLLILGERGVGKDIAARFIHERSARCHQSFVPVNVNAVTDPLFEAHLFGHRRGAFTGAHEHHDGYLMEAHGGTLFLDEIGALNMSLQAKLLRAAERKPFRPLGAKADRTSNFRLLAATNEDLNKRIREDTFRADLRDRLGAVPLRVPSLRERSGDLGLLVAHFMDRPSAHRALTPPTQVGVRQIFETYHWPGNIRELELAVEQLLLWMTQVKDEAGVLRLAEELVGFLRRQAAQTAKNDEPDRHAMHDHSREAFERREVVKALEHCGWDMEALADYLGTSERTVYRKLKRVGIQARARSSTPPAAEAQS